MPAGRHRPAMPGSPEPVLGGDPLTAGVGLAVGALFAGAVVAVADRTPPDRLAAGVGIAHAATCLGAWHGARLLTRYPAGDPAEFVGFQALAAAVLAVQVAVPAYCFARWRLRAALAAVPATSGFALFLFLRVLGETDPLWLYAVLFGPVVVGGTVALAAGEAGLRRVVATRQGTP